MKSPLFRKFNWPRIILAILMLGLTGLGSTQPAHAEGVFISAPNRVDMIHDPNRNILYISSGGEVLRYSLATQAFLPSFQLGGSLMGMDLSPDANTLAVADNTYSNGTVWIHLVNLQNGTSQKVTFAQAFSEGGTYTVAFGNDGNILITSRFLGSGWVPLRKYNPTTGATTTLWSVTQDTMLTSSADGSVIGFAESNISDGRWGRYRVSDGNIVERTGYTDGTGWFDYEIGTSRNGTQYAIPTYGGTFVYDSNFAKIATLGQYTGPQPIGVVYHPTKDIVYFAWADLQEVQAFETATFTQVATFNFEYTFQIPANHAFTQGRLKISRDGSLLFATVGGGIRYVRAEDVITLINGLIFEKERVCSLGWINDPNVCKSLDAKLKEAKDAILRGQTNTAKSKLNDFIDQLEAQLGKGVNQLAFNLLKASALYIINHLP